MDDTCLTSPRARVQFYDRLYLSNLHDDEERPNLDPALALEFLQFGLRSGGFPTLHGLRDLFQMSRKSPREPSGIPELLDLRLVWLGLSQLSSHDFSRSDVSHE